MADEQPPQIPNTYVPQPVMVGTWFSAAPGQEADRIIASITAGKEHDDAKNKLVLTPKNRLVIHGKNLDAYTQARIFDGTGRMLVVPGILQYAVVNGQSRTEPETLTFPLLDYGDNEFNFTIFLDSTVPGVAPLRLTQKFVFKRETDDEKQKRQQQKDQADDKQHEAQAAEFENKETQNLQTVGPLTQNISEQNAKDGNQATNEPSATGIGGGSVHTWPGKKTGADDEDTLTPKRTDFTSGANQTTPAGEQPGAKPTHIWKPRQQKRTASNAVTKTGQGQNIAHDTTVNQGQQGPQNQNADSTPVQSATGQAAPVQNQGPVSPGGVGQSSGTFSSEAIPQSAPNSYQNQSETPTTNGTADIKKVPKTGQASPIPTDTSQVTQTTEPESLANSQSTGSTGGPNQSAPQQPTPVSFSPQTTFDREQTGIPDNVLEKGIFKQGGTNVLPQGNFGQTFAQNKSQQKFGQAVLQAEAGGILAAAGSTAMVFGNAFDDPIIPTIYQRIDSEVQAKAAEFTISGKGTTAGQINVAAYEKIKTSIESKVWGEFAIAYEAKAMAYRSQIRELDLVMTGQDMQAQGTARPLDIKTFTKQKTTTQQKNTSQSKTETQTQKDVRLKAEYEGKFKGFKKRETELEGKLNIETFIQKPGKRITTTVTTTKEKNAIEKSLGQGLAGIPIAQNSNPATKPAKTQTSSTPTQTTSEQVEEQQELEEDENFPQSLTANLASVGQTDFDDQLPGQQQRDLAMLRSGQKLSSRQKKGVEDERVKYITQAVNKEVDGFLTTVAATVWASIILIPIGALVGDFIWAFKNQVIMRALQPYLRTEALRQKAQEIVKEIKLSANIKTQIIFMNLVTILAILLPIIIILFVGCNFPFPGEFSTFGALGYGDICTTISSATNIDMNIGAKVGNSIITGGKCSAVLSGPASTANLVGSCFGDYAAQASGIAGVESGGDATIQSKTDICTVDGTAVSWGLFQINISANPVRKITGTDASGKYVYGVTLDCPSAFTHAFDAQHKDCALKPGMQSLYQQCVAAITDPQTNIQTACYIAQIKKPGDKPVWNAWGGNSRCGF